jgi:V8-like Glu-specific endopeptidase
MFKSRQPESTLRAARSAQLLLTTIIYAASCARLGAAIVRVDMEAGASAPQRRADETEMPDAAPGGDPIDFRYYAVRKYKALSEEEALDEARRNPPVNEAGGPQSLIVQNLLTNPGLYTDEGWIAEDENVPPDWHQLVNDRRKVISAAMRAVGRIQVYHSDHVDATADCFLAGTGFLVTPNILMTNRHVAEFFCKHDDNEFPFKVDGRTNTALVKVNFAGTRDDVPVLRKVTDVLYVGPRYEDEGADVALLQIEPTWLDAHWRPPLPLQNSKPNVDFPERRLYVCGYPRVGALDFVKTLRVKRLSLGRLITESEWQSRNRLYHNCLTLNGSSGSPVIDFETGTVWGLHFHSNGTTANFAEPMWDICQMPEVREHLGDVATTPPGPVAAEIDSPTVATLQESRPVAFLCGDDFDDRPLPLTPEERQRLRQVMAPVVRSVGLISQTIGEGQELSPIGTGFVLAPGLVIAPHIPTGIDQEDKRRFVVDFDRSVCSTGPDPAVRFEADRIYSFGGEGSIPFRLSILRLHPRRGADVPPPVPLDLTSDFNALSGHPAFVVGHPLQVSRAPESVFAVVFPPPYGVKRLALGQVLDVAYEDQRVQLIHDCSTAVGDAGAPLVLAESGKVVAIHFAGEYLKANQAMPIKLILQHPELRSISEVDAHLRLFE